MLKIKPLNIKQILISIDRLTRFKHPEEKYLRVFRDILFSNLISPKFNKNDLNKMEYSTLRDYAQEIINYSLKKLNLTLSEDYTINQQIYNYENSIFRINSEVNILLQNKINYRAICELIPDNTTCVNLKWFKQLATSKDIQTDRKNLSLLYPLEKIIIVEGITEEILLPEFAKLYDYDFAKNGVYILSAGGKAQVVKMYYKLIKEVKLPVFVLVDKDARENYETIKSVLREFDKIYILKCGEFEDLLPISLIKKTLSWEFKNISFLDMPVTRENGIVKNLEEIYKHRGLHEFKKSEFAKNVKVNLATKEDTSSEMADIIRQIESVKLNSKILVDN